MSDFRFEVTLVSVKRIEFGFQITEEQNNRESTNVTIDINIDIPWKGTIIGHSHHKASNKVTDTNSLQENSAEEVQEEPQSQNCQCHEEEESKQSMKDNAHAANQRIINLSMKFTHTSTWACFFQMTANGMTI